MGKLTVNLLGQSQEDTAEDEFELKEVEVVIAPPANERFEETIFSVTAGLNCIVTSPDGLITAAAREDGIINIIDENTGAKLKTVKVSEEEISCLALSHQTSMLYAGEGGKYNAAGKKIHVINSRPPQ